MGELLLDRVQSISGVADALHSDDVHALNRVEGRQARVDGAVHEGTVGVDVGDHDRAGAAAPLATSEFCASQPIVWWPALCMVIWPY